jgi:hypothetical protein
MAHVSRRDQDGDLDRDLRELRLAVGLEERETTNDDHEGKTSSQAQVRRDLTPQAR